MTRLLWFDHLCKADTDSSPIRAQLCDIVTATGGTRLRTRTVINDSIIFVHDTANLTRIWIPGVEKSSNAVIILVSGAPSELPESEPAKKFYSLKRNREEFFASADFAPFIASCKTGRPEFLRLLLSSSAVPENTLALLLVEVARRRLENEQLGATVYDELVAGSTREVGGQGLAIDADARIEQLRAKLATW